MNRSANPNKRSRLPPAIIQYAVWLYDRFNRSHRRFSSPRQAQRLLGTHAVVYNPFNLQRHLASAAFYRFRRARICKRWNEAVAA
jgi:hypothetical protein